MASKFELATAYVAILPSLEGISEGIEEQMRKAIPSARDTLASGLRGALPSATSGLSSVAGSIGGIVGRGLTTAVTSAGRLMADTFATAGRVAGTAITAGIGAVGAQVVGGGLQRSLNINQAESSLKALGYSGEEMAEIMETANKAVEGTGHYLDHAVTAANQFLAAGITNQDELLSTLQATGKLADMAGVSFGEMGSIMGKNAASGVVQWEDLVQIMDRGVNISSTLADVMGVTTNEVRSMAAAGEISFKDFNAAIQEIEFDSVLYAAENVTVAFNNVRGYLSLIGETMWDPIMDGAGPVFLQMQEWLIDLQANKGFEDAMQKWGDSVENFYAKIQPALDKISDWFGSSDNLSGFFDEFESKAENFKSNIKGMEGPVVGLAVAIGSAMLSQIPIIGNMFGGITVGVGLMGGALWQVYNDSEALQESVGRLGERLVDVFDSSEVDVEGGLGSIGDNLAGIVDNISLFIGGIETNFDLGGLIGSIIDNINSFLEVIYERGGEISTAIGGMFENISGAFEGDSASLGEGLANTLVTLFTAVVDILGVAVPAIVSAVDMVTEVAASDFMQGVFGILANIATWVVGNEAILLSMAGILGTMFVVGKVAGPIMAVVKFFKGFGGAAAAPIAAGAKGLGTAIGAGIQALSAVGMSILTAVPGILAGIAGISAIIIAVGAISWVFSNFGVYDELLNLATFLGELLQNIAHSIASTGVIIVAAIATMSGDIATVIENIWTAVEPILEFAFGSILTAFETYADKLIEAASVILDGVVGIIEASGNAVEQVTNGVSGLIETLDENGMGAAINAGALAGGLFSLAGALTAMAAGNMINSISNGLGNLWEGFTGFVSGNDGGNELLELAEVFSEVSSIIEAMPEDWIKAGDNAYTAGVRIITGLDRGMSSQLRSVEVDILSQIRKMMNNIQAEINSHQLYIRMPDTRFGGGRGYGTVNNNTNNNTTINANTSNSRVLDQILKSSR